VSTDGSHWTSLGTIASVAGANAFFPEAAVASDGTVSVTFDALTAPPAASPWQTGVQTYDNYYVQARDPAAGFTVPLRISTAASNPDGSSYNSLEEQFIGDYIGIVDSGSTAYVIWTDARAATRCVAADAYRNDLYAGLSPVAPNPDQSYAVSFGNTDSELAAVPLG